MQPPVDLSSSTVNPLYDSSRSTALSPATRRSVKLTTSDRAALGGVSGGVLAAARSASATAGVTTTEISRLRALNRSTDFGAPLEIERSDPPAGGPPPNTRGTLSNIPRPPLTARITASFLAGALYLCCVAAASALFLAGADGFLDGFSSSPTAATIGGAGLWDRVSIYAPPEVQIFFAGTFFSVAVFFCEATGRVTRPRLVGAACALFLLATILLATRACETTPTTRVNATSGGLQSSNFECKVTAGKTPLAADCAAGTKEVCEAAPDCEWALTVDVSVEPNRRNCTAIDRAAKTGLGSISCPRYIAATRGFVRMNTNITCTSHLDGTTLETPIADVLTLTELGEYVGE